MSVPLLHHELLALLVAKIEFRDGDGFGRPFVGGFDCPEVLAALAQQRDAPSPELLGLSL